MKTAIEMIADERKRQIEVEGFTAKHDDNHKSSQLEILAMLYSCPAKYRSMLSPINWFKSMGWDFKWWKPTSRIRELIKAGALLVAAIERLQRIEENHENIQR